MDLTTARVAISETPPELLRRFLGARLLHDLVWPEVDPPERRSSNAPRATRNAMSRLTGAHGDADTGRHFVAELWHAGFDALLVTGRAAVPSILRVIDQAIEIVPAPELWRI